VFLSAREACDCCLSPFALLCDMISFGDQRKGVAAFATSAAVYALLFLHHDVNEQLPTASNPRWESMKFLYELYQKTTAHINAASNSIRWRTISRDDTSTHFSLPIYTMQQARTRQESPLPHTDGCMQVC